MKNFSVFLFLISVFLLSLQNEIARVCVQTDEKQTKTYKINQLKTMENKLKELTDRLYGEGLEKGRVEADRLVAEAKEKAAKILADAAAEAEQIVKKAEAKAADTEKNSMTEIQLAGRQAVAKIKSELAGAIIAKTSTEAIKSAVVDAEFVKVHIADFPAGDIGKESTCQCRIYNGQRFHP